MKIETVYRALPNELLKRTLSAVVLCTMAFAIVHKSLIAES